MPKTSIVAVHWHYAVWQPRGYIPQISLPRLKQLAKSGTIEKVVLCLVEAPKNTIRKRRLGDSHMKKRALSLFIIGEEIAAEERFLHKHQNLFDRALGSQHVSTFRLTNANLAVAKRLLSHFFASL